MYQVGEKIIYGSNGVCVIEGIKMIEVPRTGEEKAYYVIKPMFQECRISAPVDTKMFMRPIISAEEANTLLESLPLIDAQPYFNTALRQLQDYYEKQIATHDCSDLAAMLIALYRKREQMLSQKRKFGAIDERYMKRAEELLFGELSVVLDMTKAEIRQAVHDKLGK
ncbi:MAG: hypothetical protein IJA67_03855 [Oscillospiraceae bacterium]|nr:hypothetical protein [Oscillospiraceae bacterium]